MVTFIARQLSILVWRRHAKRHGWSPELTDDGIDTISTAHGNIIHTRSKPYNHDIYRH